MIEDNKLIRETLIAQGNGWKEYRKDIVITKEEFIACYDTWIKENKE